MGTFKFIFTVLSPHEGKYSRRMQSKLGTSYWLSVSIVSMAFVAIPIMSCLIILSNLKIYDYFGVSVQMYSGWQVFNIYFQNLGLKSDPKKGVFWGRKFNIKTFTFSQHKQFIINKHWR
jgi:hypothetical protein